MAVEYPTYGIYAADGIDMKNERFEKDGCAVYDFLLRELGLNSKQIIIMGRSIGSGPATLLASNRAAGCFLLFSPLLSVNEVAKAIPSVGWLASMIIPSAFFNNAELVKNIHTPTFIIHGKNDEVVPHSHGESLYNNSSAHINNKHLHSVPNMTHNDFHLQDDLITPFKAYLSKIGLTMGQEPNLKPIYATAFIEKYHKPNAAAVNLQLL